MHPEVHPESSVLNTMEICCVFLQYFYTSYFGKVKALLLIFFEILTEV